MQAASADRKKFIRQYVRLKKDTAVGKQALRASQAAILPALHELESVPFINLEHASQGVDIAAKNFVTQETQRRYRNFKDPNWKAESQYLTVRADTTDGVSSNAGKSLSMTVKIDWAATRYSAILTKCTLQLKRMAATPSKWTRTHIV